jgi:hypothetical protein
MNLRKQLLLVSLLTLILPWAGCQFIRETESALREGQQQMLSGTARAIADSLSQFPDELLASRDDLKTGNNQLYGHPLATAPLIDGYFDEWTTPEDSAISLRGADGAIRYVVGRYRPHLYLHLDVRDASVIFDRGQDAIFPRSYSDHVALISIDETGERTTFRFRAEAPGEIIAVRETGGEVFDETRIAAYWQDTPGGYRLEARIPQSLLGKRLGLVVSNTGDATRPGVRSATFDGDLPGRFVTISPVLQSVAAGYVQPGLRLIVTDKSGWRLGQAGSISGAPEGTEDIPPSTGWLRLAYNLLLEPGAAAALAEPDASGRERESGHEMVSQPRHRSGGRVRRASHFFRQCTNRSNHPAARYGRHPESDQSGNDAAHHADPDCHHWRRAGTARLRELAIRADQPVEQRRGTRTRRETRQDIFTERPGRRRDRRSFTEFLQRVATAR